MLSSERAERASAAPPVGAAAEDSPALPTKDTGAAAGASAASATEDPPASDDLFPAASTSDHEPEEGTPSPRPTRQTTSPKQTKSTKATNQPKLTKATKQPKPSKVSSAKPPKPTKKPTRKASASKPRTSSARSSPAVSPRPLCHRRLGQVFPRPSQSSPPKRSSTDGSSVDRSPPRSDSHKESDEAAHPVAASRKGTDAQSAEAPTEAQQNVRAAAQPLYDICSDNGDDINTDPIGNNNYDVLDSGDESEEEDLSELNVSDSESSASDCIDEDDEELFAKEERHFADKFLESLGGQEKVLAGELIGPALKDLSTTGWDDPETPDVAAYLETPYDWLAQRRLRFRMAKMIGDNTWPNRFFDRHKPMPGVILDEVLQKIQKSWQSQPIEPKSVLGPVSADQVRGHAQKRPRGRRSPPRGEPQAPTSYDYSGSPATLPDTGTDRYARGASVASRHGSRGRPHYQAEAAEPAAGVVSDQDAQRRSTGSRPDLESLLSGVESCQRLLDGQRTEMVALRARVQDAEARLEKLQDVREDLDCLRDRVWDLPRQLGGDVDRLRGRCSQGEENDERTRQGLERHVAWIRDLYDRVGHLEAWEARRVAARAPDPAPTPAPAPAQLPSEELVRMMANAFQQYSATQSAPQDQQPPPGDRA
ncbi:hypothetical protein PR001_g23448 [Phytophthora rubi]|uniref:Uncharacterized protein n=2 Tax=Phytophthora rubi TaxID=129364 RepID=A0A6A3IMY8_9STRA|nr:hypothetical protein PR001_g23448 [Phytophthora rubi]